MMNMRSIVMLLVALAAGVASVMFAARWMQQQTPGSDSKVAVAVSDIQLGSRIAPEMVKMVDWPTGSVPSGAFNDPKTLDGRVLRTTVTRGEALLEGKLAAIGAQGGLSSVVSEGKRAITVRVNDVVGVAGFALPGNFVDIMVNTQENGSRAGDKEINISKIVLETILVLAVAQEVGRDDTKPRVVNAVTLEVTPEQAEKLDLARSIGTLSLVLRNQSDPKPSLTVGATKDSLLGRAVLAPAPASAPHRPPPQRMALAVQPATGNCVEVIRGTRKSNECF